MDLSKVVLIIGNVRGTENILDLSENKKFEFRPSEEDDNWKGKDFQSHEASAPYLSLVMGENMFAPGGWILGSDDDDTCDVQIARDNKTGVSRKHLRVDLSPDTNSPRITNLSRNVVRIHDSKGKHGVSLGSNSNLEILSAVCIDFGKIQMTAWRPRLSQLEERAYRLNAEEFSKQFLDARLIPRSSSGPTGQSTFNVRFGLKDAVYARDESDHTGVGSFASVFKVQELHSRKVYAAKMPHFKSDTAGKARKRWESLTNEFRMMISLKHPNIVKAIEVVEGAQANEPPWLIMEWIPMDLSSFPLRDEDIPTALRHISSGLAYMHNAGHTHRDLKPANILIEHSKGFLVTAKIADFGTTKYDLSGNMHTYTGTSVYMAPEFWEQDLAYTKAVDLWSFGVLALELLTTWHVEGWDSRAPPSKAEHRLWLDEALYPRIGLAPQRFAPLLEGLLCHLPSERWSAVKCKDWMVGTKSAKVVI